MGSPINVGLVMAILLSVFIEMLFIYKHTKTNPSVLMEGMTSKRKKKKKGISKNVKKMLKKRKFPKGKYSFDAKRTYKKTYNNLSGTQVHGLKKDTKELVKTQEQLMSTLKEMGPVLEQGKTIIGAFDSFFGDKNSKNDISYMTKRLGIKNKK